MNVEARTSSRRKTNAPIGREMKDKFPRSFLNRIVPNRSAIIRRSVLNFVDGKSREETAAVKILLRTEMRR
jgi:hypothetical protein